MDVIQLRRDLHQFPEVGFTEFRTASIVVETLKALGYQVIYGKDALDPEARRGLPSEELIDNAYRKALDNGANPTIVKEMRGGNTAVIGVLEGSKPGPTIAFRFDMDALPVLESSNSKHAPVNQGFRSKIDGNMHACAHDAHTAIGLSLAKNLANLNIKGKIKLIFQPAEEGARGAYAIIEKGHLKDVDKLFCFHLGFDYQLGEIYAGSTGWLATTKLLTHFHGKPSHTGMSPQDGRNALLGAATALLNIHAIPRYSKGETRVGVGVLEGGTSANITPYFAKMISESRADTEAVNEELEQKIKAIIANSAEMHGLTEETFIIGKGSTINCDETVMEVVMEEAKKISMFHTINKFGRANGGEDASLLLKEVQKHGGEGTYMLIGTPISAPHHNEMFDIDEAILEPTVELFSKIAVKELAVN